MEQHDVGTKEDLRAAKAKILGHLCYLLKLDNIDIL
jgi:hypothetical protein